MARTRTPTIGDEHAARLTEALRALAHTPLDGARGLPELTGLRAPPKSIYTQPQDNVILQAIGVLTASGKVYAHGRDIVYESDALDGSGQTLTHLRIGSEVEPGAECRLANLFTCREDDTCFPPPRWFANLLLASDLLHGRLPRIRMYANRPVFDADFHLCSAGWNEGPGFLVHGPHVEPVPPEPGDPNRTALDRLPRHLRALLGGFCFCSCADVTNALAMLLTGLLANHFVEPGKGVFLIDGNQPGLGKTLLVRVAGIVLDGTDPWPISYAADDEELLKRICALLRGSLQSLVLVDNAKATTGGVISSPAIEANSMAPTVALRILGRSATIDRPNDLLWVLTMNDTRVSPDLASRGVPIRLAYEGRAENRTFPGPGPLCYARRHRLEILGELAGMVVGWDQAGRPTGHRSHRCHEWAGVVGGVLNAAGFPEFLANAEEAAAAFNAQLEDLAALAEAVVGSGGPFIEIHHPNEEWPVAENENTKLTAEGWLRYFAKADLLNKELAEAKSTRAKSILIGRFLSRNVDRTVPMQAMGRSGLATLRVEARRSNRKRYFFEVRWDTEPEGTAARGAVATETPVTGEASGVVRAPAPTARSACTRVSNDIVVAGAPTRSSTAPGPLPRSPDAGNDEAWE